LQWRGSITVITEAAMENGNFTMADQINRVESPWAQRRTDHVGRWVAVVIGEDTLVAWWTLPLRRQTDSWPGTCVCEFPNWREFDPTWIG